MKNGIITTIILVFLAGCTKQESVEIPQHIKEVENLTIYTSGYNFSKNIRFEKEQVFGNDENQFIGHLSGVAIDSAGLVYIADSQEMNIKIYDSDGIPLTTIGQRGQGPGEFQEISSIQIKGERLFVFDRNQQRVLLFSINPYRYDYSVQIADNRAGYDEIAGAHLNNVYVRKDDSFLKEFSETRMPENISDWDKFGGHRFYYFLDKNGEISSPQLFRTKSIYQVLIPFGGRRTGMPFEFYGSPITNLSNDDYIFHVWSQDLLIYRYTPEGEYKHAFYYPLKRIPLKPESVFSGANDEFILRAVQSMEFPDYWPVLNDMLIDDQDRLWIATTVEDMSIYEWWILEETGELITRFEWPRDEPIEVIKNGFMYTLQTDKESGLQQIVQYKIEFEEV